MAYGGEIMGSTDCAPKGMLQATRPSFTECLRSQREDLKKRLAELDSAIAAIEANPSVQEVLDALSKMGEIR